MVHYEYDGKVALVTGASSGIGKATAIAFGAAGAKVVVAARREAESEAVAETIRSAGGEALFVQTDVSEPDQVEAMVAKTVDKFGRLDFAFNNAGGGGLPGLRMHEVSVEDWDRQTHVYLRSVFLSMKFEVTQMLEQDGGTIVNNASVLGLVGNVGSGAYPTMKHGVVGLTKSAALTYGEDGIRVNAVCPGWIHTEMTETWKDDPDISSRLHARQAMKRHGEPEEIAGMVLWLCSDAASFTTGSAMVVDGGLLA